MHVGPGMYIRKESCGYCKTSDGANIWGMSVKSMSSDEYQQLCNRGFRRSGSFVYKPDLRQSCCPQYTIRLDVQAYKPSKEQRQTLNRFNRGLSMDSTPSKRKGKDNTFDLSRSVHEPELNGSLRIELDLATNLTDEKFELFKQYQMYVHNETEDEVTRNGFKRFLCTDPFTDEGDSPAKHQLYYHNDKLIAIGVIDVLPQCISSVYLIWHPDYAKYGIGKVAALREIALARELNKPYYYMGYYIHSCIKMRYKGQYKPSYLLEPRFTELPVGESHWRPVEDFSSQLDSERYVTLIDEAEPPADPASKKLEEVGMPGLEQHVNSDLVGTIPLIVKGPMGMRLPVSLDDIDDRFTEMVVGILRELVMVLGNGLASQTTLDLT